MLEKKKSSDGEKVSIKGKVSEEEYRALSEHYKELENFENYFKKRFSSEEQFQKFYGLLLKQVDQIVRTQSKEKNRIVQENKEQKVKNEELRKENKEQKIKNEELRKENEEQKVKNEKLKKENNALKEKMAQEKRKWEEAKEKILQENEELQGRNEELRKQNETFSVLEEKYRSYLTAHFLSLQETLWEMDENGPVYEAFFHDSVLPLQILIGLEKGKDCLTEEQVDYYLWDVIVDPLMRVMKKRQGEVQNGKLVLPKQELFFEKEKMAQKIERESIDNIEQYIKEDTRRVELKEIVQKKKRIVEDLGRFLEELEEISKVHAISNREIERLAAQVRFLFERNGIYPFFAEELKEYSNSELERRLIPSNPNSIPYPGLFVKRNGEWEVLGTNIGMDGG